jgi:hypothetical protein
MGKRAKESDTRLGSKQRDKTAADIGIGGDMFLKPPSAMRRLGEYTVDTPDEYFELQRVALRVGKSILFALIKVSDKSMPKKFLEIKIAVKPVSDSEAVVEGLGNAEGGTLWRRR